MKRTAGASTIVHVALGILTGLAIYISNIGNIQVPGLEFLLNAIITSAATFSGFILTSVSILIGAISSTIMQEIKRKDALKELHWRYSESLILGMLLIIYFAVLGAVIGEKNIISLPLASLSAGFLMMYICSVCATGYYLLSIIGLLNEDKRTISNISSTPKGDFR